MMKLKKFAALLLSLLLVFTLCSCGKVTAESVIADMIKAVSKTDSFAGTMDMEIEYSIGIAGKSIDTSSAVYADVAYANGITYVNGAATTETSGAENTTAVLESYTVNEGDAVTSYTQIGGKWYKTTMDKPDIDAAGYLKTIVQLMDPANRGNVVLQEETDNLNGREVYVLKIADCNYPELITKTVFTQLENVLGDIDIADIDLSGVTMQVTVMVYKDTKLPAQLTVDFGDSLTSVTESLTDMIVDSMMGELTGVEGIDIGAVLGGLDLRMEIPKAFTTICFNEYNTEPIVIPAEALDALEITVSDSGGIFDNLLLDTGNGDGDSVTLYSGDGAESVKLGQIQGVERNSGYTDDFNVYYESSDENGYTGYMFYFVSLDGYTPEGILTEAVPAYKDYLAQQEYKDITVSAVQTTIIGGYEVSYVVFDYVSDSESRDILSIVAYKDKYGIAIEAYTTGSETDPVTAIENCVGAIH